MSMRGHAALSKNDPALSQPGLGDGTARDCAARGDSLNNSRTSLGLNASKFQEEEHQNFRETLPQVLQGPDLDEVPCFEMNAAQWGKICAKAFYDHMQSERISVKEMANKMGCKPRTVENYLAEDSTPAGLHFLRAIAVIPEFASEVRRVTGMVKDLDPKADRAAIELAQAASKFLSVRHGSAN